MSDFSKLNGYDVKDKTAREEVKYTVRTKRLYSGEETTSAIFPDEINDRQYQYIIAKITGDIIYDVGITGAEFLNVPLYYCGDSGVMEHLYVGYFATYRIELKVNFYGSTVKLLQSFSISAPITDVKVTGLTGFYYHQEPANVYKEWDIEY